MGNFNENDIVLENYRIERSIGQGAFGEVYLATDTGLNGKRAIKVLLRDDIGVGSSSYNNFRDRFRQEAQLMEWFNNPHIVRIYNFQEVDNTLFLVMEYAPGGSLQQKMDKASVIGRKFTPEEVARIGIDIADGLAALHSRDVVHRDLKPSNILFDAEDNAKVADLGLAQVPGAQSTRTELSNPLPHPGTQAYMSPEHANANIYLTPPSDIYALGLILFKMMTGRNYKILEPGKRLRDIRPDAPEWLNDLLARMLHKEPEKRPWNGERAAEELRKGLAEELAKKKVDGPVPDENSLDKQILLLFEQGMAAIKEKDWLAARRVVSALKTLGEKGNDAATRIESLIPSQPLPPPPPWKNSKVIVSIGFVTLVVLGYAIYGALPGGKQLEFTSTIPVTEITMNSQTQVPQVAETIHSTETVPAEPLEIGSTIVREKDGMVMMYVPAGEFTMGSITGEQDERPEHMVSLPAYWIDQTEVTNGMFSKCVSDGSCQPPVKKTSKTREDYFGDSSLLDYPVINIDWNQAKSYCEWAGGRLPNEAEWEKAARGVDKRIYPRGGKAVNYTYYANFNGADTTRVGEYEDGVSPYGLHDMAGNVWEWTEDNYDVYPGGDSKVSAYFSEENKIIRGGAFNDPITEIRTSNRGWLKSTNSLDSLGFRCAKSN